MTSVLFTLGRYASGCALQGRTLRPTTPRRTHCGSPGWQLVRERVRARANLTLTFTLSLTLTLTLSLTLTLTSGFYAWGVTAGSPAGMQQGYAP